MKKNFPRFLKNPTVVSIFGTAVIIVGIPLLFYAATLGGGAGLGAFIILGWLAIVGVVLFVDRILVRRVKPLTLSIVESIIGGLAILFIIYQKREVTVDISENKAGYFIVFYAEEGLTESSMDKKFLFDRKITLNNNSILISKSVKEKYNIDFEFPSTWWERGTGVGSSLGTIEDNIEYEFFRIIPLTDVQKDSVLELEINSAANHVYK